MANGDNNPQLSPYTKAGPYQTQLQPDEEDQFQSWVKSNKIPWQDSPTSDYDMRGFWKAQQAGDPNAKRAANLHFPDTYKTPYHKTFSNESKYATAQAPHWEGNRLVPTNTPQVDWQNDPNFHALPLTEKHKVLLQIDPNYKGLPAKEQAQALDTIHYGSLGQISGEGISLKGVGTGAGNFLKGMYQDPTGGHPLLSKEAWLGAGPTFKPEESGIAKMGQEASTEYQRARAAGTNPLAAGYSAALSGGGPLVGISDIEQQKLAAQGEGGQIVGQSAVPIGMTLAAPLVGRMMPKGGAVPAESTGGLSPEVTGAIGRKIGHATRIPFGGSLGDYIGRKFGTPGVAPPEPKPFPGATSTATPVGSAELPPAKGAQTPFPRVQTRAEIRSAEAANKAAVKAAEKAQVAAEKAAAKAPSNPFAGMTSTATPIGNAELPPVSPEQPAPMPAVTKTARKGMSAPPTVEETAASPKTSLLSRGRTLVEPGLEPDMNNPVHVKMINDYQTMSGPALRTLAGAGDRFAAFVLRHMPRP